MTVRGEGMPGKRRGLARRRGAMGLTQERLAARLGVERSTIYRWESGEVTPQPDIQPRLARELAVSPAELVDLLVEGASSVEPVTPSATVRVPVTARSPQPQVVRSVRDLQGRIDLGTNPQDFLAATAVRTPLPTRLGRTEVEHVRATTQAVALSENLFGGGLSCEAALAQLRWSGRLLDVQASNQIYREIAEAIGNLASVVAFAAFDIANYDAADRSFEFALWCADEADSWTLRANTLAEMARKAAYLRHRDEALELIEFAQVRSDRLTATGRAMLATLRARLLALNGQHAQALAEIDRADAEFADHDPDADPPWLCYYDTAEHQGSTGKALIPIARARNSPEMAAGRLTTAVELQAADYPRSRTFSRIRLASLMMATGHPQEAVEIGNQAVIDTASLRSTRLMTELRGLARTASTHAQVGEVADLRHDIARLELTPSAQ